MGETKPRTLREDLFWGVVQVTALSAVVGVLWHIPGIRPRGADSPNSTPTPTDIVASPQSNTRELKELRGIAKRNFYPLVDGCDDMGVLRTSDKLLRTYGADNMGSLLMGRSGIYNPTFRYEKAPDQSQGGDLLFQKMTLKVEFGAMIANTDDTSTLAQLSDGLMGLSSLGEMNNRMIRQSCMPYEKCAVYTLGGGLCLYSAYNLLRRKSTTA